MAYKMRVLSQDGLVLNNQLQLLQFRFRHNEYLVLKVLISFLKFVMDKFMLMTTVEVKDLKKEVKKYIDLADERMIKAVFAMLEADQHDDWWDKISDGERAAVETGLKQMEEGKTTPHEIVMKKHSKWLTK